MSLDLCDLSNTQVLDYLSERKDDIVMLFSNCNTEQKNKNQNIIANLEFYPNTKYVELYNELTKIPMLWKNIGYMSLTLLQQICYRGDVLFVPCITNLIQYPDLWEICCCAQNTALHLLIYSFRNYYKIEFHNILLELTKYPRLWSYNNNNNSTPLHEVCLFRNDIIVDIAEGLTNYPDLWEKYDGHQMTPLHYLCSHSINIDKKKYINLFSRLSKYIHLWKNKDYFGYTPLHLFCRNFPGNEFYEIYKKFERFPELWTIQNRNGLTPKDMLA